MKFSVQTIRYGSIVFFVLAGLLLIQKLHTINFSSNGNQSATITDEKLESQYSGNQETKQAGKIIEPSQIIPQKDSLQVVDLSIAEQKKYDLLLDVLDKKRDNDKNVDTELVQLSVAFHKKLFQLYDDIEIEKRNERGFVAFIISRDIQGAEDIEFLKKIFKESPCLGLSSCQEVETSEPHHSGVNEITLHYPQLMTLQSLEKKIAQLSIGNQRNLLSGIRSILQEAKNFPVLRVQNKAKDLEELIPL